MQKLQIQNFRKLTSSVILCSILVSVLCGGRSAIIAQRNNRNKKKREIS